ncbi:MAG TPA: L-2-amino-thiazoline-4-carboxylic acid hydrolase [Gaiellaceae bacterium]
MANPDSMNDQANSCAEQWKKLLDWLDFWFQPEKAEAHDFASGERELFDSLVPAWLEAKPGEGKIAALDAAAERFGRERVHALLGKICGDETRAYWAGLVREEGSSLEDLVRLLWEPLPELGFEFSSERRSDGLQFCVTHCPHAELAARLGGDSADWFLRTVCATDLYVVDAFDPPIRFQRTKTLMQGDDCCDHAYFVD